MSERYPKYSLKIWYMEISFNTNNWLSKDTDEEQLMHSKSENRNYDSMMKYDKADEVFKELFEWLLSRYQIDLVTTMKASRVFFLIGLICCVANVIK